MRDVNLNPPPNFVNHEIHEIHKKNKSPKIPLIKVFGSPPLTNPFYKKGFGRRRHHAGAPICTAREFSYVTNIISKP